MGGDGGGAIVGGAGQAGVSQEGGATASGAVTPQSGLGACCARGWGGTPSGQGGATGAGAKTGSGSPAKGAPLAQVVCPSRKKTRSPVGSMAGNLSGAQPAASRAHRTTCRVAIRRREDRPRFTVRFPSGNHWSFDLVNRSMRSGVGAGFCGWPFGESPRITSFMPVFPPARLVVRFAPGSAGRASGRCGHEFCRPACFGVEYR